MQMYPVLLEESALLQVSLAQGVLEDLVVLIHQRVLHLQGSSTIRGSSISIRGPSTIRGSSSSRRPSISIGVPCPRRSSLWVSSSIRWPSTLTGISPSFRGSPIPIWSSNYIVIITTFSWVFPSS